MQLKTRIFHKLIYLRLFFLSLLGALTLSLLSFYTVIRVADSVVQDYRFGYLQYLSRKIEKLAVDRPFHKIKIQDLAEDTAEVIDPIVNVEDYKSLKPQQDASNQPMLWLINEKGRILATNSVRNLPGRWLDLPRPKKVHEVRSTEKGFFKPRTFVIKLETTPTTYLISHNSGFFFKGPMIWIQGAHTFITATLAIFFALSITVLYLRRKSKDARDVLSRLESGDLKARFKIKRFDEFGSLLLDFNRMANQIEGLVKKVNDAESARSNLLQELGHDVRTPLTSLSTSFDTLRVHHDELSIEDRNELYTMLGADIRYFSDLLEKLTLIATINVPKYKASTENIDLATLLEEEVTARQTYCKNDIKWSFAHMCENPATIFGDSHLLTRLIRNAFDNASRYANNLVQVTLATTDEGITITVTDDGPGLTAEAIESFGKRRQRRQVKDRDAENFSLGLGSVIMKTIADVHNGVVAIGNAEPGMNPGGASLKVVFRPR